MVYVPFLLQRYYHNDGKVEKRSLILIANLQKMADTIFQVYFYTKEKKSINIDLIKYMRI